MKRNYSLMSDLNDIDIFLRYNQLVKHNLEINQGKETIQFTRCLKKCKIQHQNIVFILRTRKIKLTEEMDKEYYEIRKESNLTNLEDLLEYIQSFTYLFNKKKFEKLLEI